MYHTHKTIHQAEVLCSLGVCNSAYLLSIKFECLQEMLDEAPVWWWLSTWKEGDDKVSKCCNELLKVQTTTLSN